MKTNIFIVLFSIACFSSPIKINKNVSDFINGITTSHRSGLLVPGKNQEDILKWKTSIIEYGIVKSSIEKQKDSLIKNCNMPIFAYDSKRDVAILKSENDETRFRVPSKSLISNKDEFKSIAEKFILKNLPKYSVEYNSTDVTTITTKEKTSILNGTVNFRRIFMEGIILGNVSFIKVAINSLGEVTNVEICWPEFIEIKNNRSSLKEEDNTIPATKLLSIVSDDYSDINSMTDGKDDTPLSSAEIIGSARGWFKMDGNILTPVYSFIVKGNLVNGESYNETTNIPVLKKYHPK